MGSRVSVADGEGSEGGHALRIYLMKQRKEDYDEDQAISQARNDKVVDTLTASFNRGTLGVGVAGAPPEDAGDVGNRYVDRSRTKLPDMFRRKR